MKKLLTLLSAVIFVATGVKGFSNPEAEKSQNKKPGFALVMKVNKDGTKTLLKVAANKKWTSEEFKNNVEKISKGSIKSEVAQIKLAKNSVNSEADEKAGITSWYWGWGHHHYSPCWGNWWGNNYWYNNNYGWGWGSGNWGYGYYYTSWYRPVYYGYNTYYYYY
ncbi:MAG: hypothetical protein KA116_03995 [Proteobacteria bacterium]|nr:hypothetical protein [Pseudomonadota bacterium]